MPPQPGEGIGTEEGTVGSSGDTSGGFRIAGGNLLFTPTGAQTFSPGSWVPLGSPSMAPPGEANEFNGGQFGDHLGAFRSGPSIFAQQKSVYINTPLRGVGVNSGTSIYVENAVSEGVGGFI